MEFFSLIPFSNSGPLEFGQSKRQFAINYLLSCKIRKQAQRKSINFDEKKEWGEKRVMISINSAIVKKSQTRHFDDDDVESLFSSPMYPNNVIKSNFFCSLICFFEFIVYLVDDDVYLSSSRSLRTLPKERRRNPTAGNSSAKLRCAKRILYTYSHNICIFIFLPPIPGGAEKKLKNKKREGEGGSSTAIFYTKPQDHPFSSNTCKNWYRCILLFLVSRWFVLSASTQKYKFL